MAQSSDDPTSTARHAAPRIPNATVRRSALLERLHGADHVRLILVSAAAGSGKSALLTQWVDELTGPVAWVACGQRDADPAGFWKHVAGAVGRAWSRTGFIGAEIVEGGSPPSPSAELCERLAASGEPGVIVIDDFHLAAVSPGEMVAFISDLPPGVRLVLATRADPQFSVSRLRLHGTLLEIRQADLRFTLDETAAALAAIRVELDETRMRDLHEVSEGWPAGVHLLGLSLRSVEPSALLADGIAGDRTLADFLLNEVLDNTRPDIADFLMVSAELESFDPDLCDDVMGRDDCAGLFDEVRAANLFVVEQDATSNQCRYHHLFSDFLRRRLRATEPDRVNAIHRSAGHVLAARGEWSDAVRHFLTGQDVDSARVILAGQITSALTVDLDNGAEVARRWLDEHGEAQLSTDPSGFLECTMALHMDGAADEAELWLRRWSAREPLLEHTPRVLLHGAWSFHHTFLGDPEQALVEARRAGDLIESEAVDDRWSDALLVLLLQAQIWLGDLDAARSTVASGLTRPSLPPPLALVRLPAFAALADFEAGELDAAERTASRALEAADRLALPELHFGRAEPELVLAAICAERGQWDEAGDRLERVMRVAEVRRPQIEVLAHLALARVADATGDRALGDLCIERARSVQPRASRVVRARIDAHDLRRALARGDRTRAGELLSRLPAGVRDDLLAARVALADGDDTTAAELLAGARPEVTTRRERIELGLLAALAGRKGDRSLVHEQLADTLTLTESAGFHRTVIEEGPAMWDLLEGVPARDRLATHVEALVVSARNEVPGAQAVIQDDLIDPLTERELTVVRYLASRLDSSEIAAALHISVNTVRSHVKAVYRKLAVNSRPEAVRRAEELGLL